MRLFFSKTSGRTAQCRIHFRYNLWGRASALPPAFWPAYSGSRRPPISNASRSCSQSWAPSGSSAAPLKTSRPRQPRRTTQPGHAGRKPRPHKIRRTGCHGCSWAALPIPDRAEALTWGRAARRCFRTGDVTGLVDRPRKTMACPTSVQSPASVAASSFPGQASTSATPQPSELAGSPRLPCTVNPPPQTPPHPPASHARHRRDRVTPLSPCNRPGTTRT
jgi:hypothetical protein